MWAEAREEMGYNAPLNTFLLNSIGGQPYVDVRASFNSFLPKGINPFTAEKFVDIWIEFLCNNPALHDKVEFNVAITSYTFDLDKKLSALEYSERIEENEKINFINLIRKQTINLIKGDNGGSIKSAMEKIYHLEEQQSAFNENLMQDDLPVLLRECIDFGTRPFAILARHAFIARNILQSLVDIGGLTKSEMELFLASIRTIASDFSSDIDRVRTRKLEPNDFLRRYGHLRPGTYEITSSKYERDLIIFDISKRRPVNNHMSGSREPFCLSNDAVKRVNNILEQHGFEGITCFELFKYCELAIANREYSKFVFTRSLSKILDIIEEFGSNLGLNTTCMSHLDIKSILDLQSDSVPGGYNKELKETIVRNKKRHEVTSSAEITTPNFRR